MHNTYIARLHYSADDSEQLLSTLNEDLFSSPLFQSCLDVPVHLEAVSSLSPSGTCICRNQNCEVYLEHGQESRYYSLEYDGSLHPLVRSTKLEDGVHIEFISGRHSLSLPPQQYYNWIYLENYLLQANSMILHSSSIIWRGHAVLFTAPSQTGKSTQADLWQKYRNAVIMNGDRNIIGLNEDTWYACSLPWHGTSPHHLNMTAPLSAVVVIRQAPTDSISRLRPFNALRLLYSETTVNNWDSDFADRMLNLIEALVSKIPVFLLNCTMQESAVTTLEQELLPLLEGI